MTMTVRQRLQIDEIEKYGKEIERVKKAKNFLIKADKIDENLKERKNKR